MTMPLSIVRGPVARQEVIGALPKVDQGPITLAGWIQLIQQTWTRGADRALELGRLLSRARQSLPYGSWSRLWQSGGLPFNRRKGEMFVVVGQGVGGLNAQNSAHLPPAWNTLYYLARLGQTLVEQLIRQGRIHPALSLREAQALLAEHHPETPRKTPRSKLEVRLRRLAAFIRAARGGWSPAEREWARNELLVLAGELQRNDTHLHSKRHKSTEVPLSRPMGTLSPAGCGGEGRGEEALCQRRHVHSGFRGDLIAGQDESTNGFQIHLGPLASRHLAQFAEEPLVLAAVPNLISQASPRHTIPIPVL